MKPQRWPPLINWLLKGVGVTVVYFGVAKLGLLLAFQETNVSPIWPPTGVALAAVFLFGYSIWPGIAIGAVLANIVTFTANDLPMTTSLLLASLIGAGNTLEAVLGVFLTRHFGGERIPLNQAQDVFKFILAVLLATMVSATIGVVGLGLGGIAAWGSFGYLWWTWWVGDIVGALVVAPLLLVWGKSDQIHKRPHWLSEAVFIFGLLVIVAWLAFGVLVESTFVISNRLEYLIIPLIVWAVFWVGRHGATAAIFITAAIATWHTVQGVGPFAIDSANNSLLLLQIYIIVVAVTALTLAGVLTERRQVEESLQSHTAELASLNAIAKAVNSSLELDEILEVALEQAMALTGLEGGTICMIPHKQNVLHLAVEREASPEMIIDLTRNEVEIGDCLCGNAALSQQPLILWEDASANPLAREAARDEGINFHGAFPLVVHERSIGVLCVFTRTDMRPTKRSLEILQIACDQIAIAIENARLYDESQHHAAQLEQRVAERTTELTVSNKKLEREVLEREQAEESLREALSWTEVLYRASRSLIIGENLPQLLQAVVDGVVEALLANRVTLITVNLKEQRVTNFVKGGPGVDRVIPVSFEELKDGLSGWVLHELKPALSPKGKPDPRESPAVQQRRTETGCGAIIVAPLQYRNKILGTITAINRPDERDFVEPDAALMMTLANQAAIAIDNSQLYEELVRQAEELTVLYEIGKDITSTLELDTMLQTITNDTIRLVDADQSLILLIDAEREKLIQAVGYGYNQAQLAGHTFEEFQNGISGWVLQEKTPTLSANIRTDKRNRGKALDRAEQSEDRAAAIAPLLIEDEVIGTLTVIKSHRKKAFTPSDLRLVTMLAGQAATAIQNAWLYEAAQESDRLKSAFLATMSHELRTPLNSIIGFTGILLQGLAGPLNGEQTKQLGMVRDSSRHLLELINDVLDISKIEAGQMKVAPKLFDVRSTLAQVVQTVIPLAEKKGIALITEISPEVDQIVSDSRRVEQILINLINNAIKFTEKGEIYVNCRLNNGRLVTQVTDTGVGIKPEDMRALFEPFRQIDTGIMRRHEGTGLGLSISKRLVEMLDGQIWVESEWGRGSTFTFTLPL